MNESLPYALRRIAWGWLLVHFNFNLGTVNILPDWLGYILILNGLLVVAKSVRSASLLFSFGIALAVWEGVEWVLAIFGGSVSAQWLTLPAAVINLYFQFQLLTNLAELADDWSCEQGAPLRKLRTVQTVLTTVLTLAMYMNGVFTYELIDLLEGYQIFWAVLLVIGGIVTICITYQLFALKNEIRDQLEPDPIPISTYKTEEDDDQPKPE